MSLTDEIYRELWDGMDKGLDWSQFMAKHRESKGPLYAAIGRFFTEVGTKIAALKEEKSLVQSELDQAGLTLTSLDRKIKEGESNIASLEDRQNTLNEQGAALETELAEKSELARHLAELEKLGINIERLSLLRDTLRQIGAKHGFKSTEVTSKFFGDLKDYEVVLGVEMQLTALQTKIETKRLEAENWQAKEEALRRKHDGLKEAIDAVYTFYSKGIKLSQIISWQQVVNKFQTVEQMAESLAKYGDMTRLLKATKEETGNYETRLAKAQSQVKALEKERVKIEEAIDFLKVAGVKGLKVMNEEAAKQVRMLADSEINEIQKIGREVRMELNDFLTRLNTLAEKLFEMGQKFEKTKQELQKYEGVRNVLESHTAVAEKENDVPKQS